MVPKMTLKKRHLPVRGSKITELRLTLTRVSSLKNNIILKIILMNIFLAGLLQNYKMVSERT